MEGGPESHGARMPPSSLYPPLGRICLSASRRVTLGLSKNPPALNISICRSSSAGLLPTGRKNAITDTDCLHYLYSIVGKRLYISTLSVAQLISVYQKRKANDEIRDIVRERCCREAWKV